MLCFPYGLEVAYWGLRAAGVNAESMKQLNVFVPKEGEKGWWHDVFGYKGEEPFFHWGPLHSSATAMGADTATATARCSADGTEEENRSGGRDVYELVLSPNNYSDENELQGDEQYEYSERYGRPQTDRDVEMGALLYAGNPVKADLPSARVPMNPSRKMPSVINMATPVPKSGPKAKAIETEAEAEVADSAAALREAVVDNKRVSAYKQFAHENALRPSGPSKAFHGKLAEYSLSKQATGSAENAGALIGAGADVDERLEVAKSTCAQTEASSSSEAEAAAASVLVEAGVSTGSGDAPYSGEESPSRGHDASNHEGIFNDVHSDKGEDDGID
jgi:hypothetical protein